MAKLMEYFDLPYKNKTTLFHVDYMYNQSSKYVANIETFAIALALFHKRSTLYAYVRKLLCKMA